MTFISAEVLTAVSWSFVAIAVALTGGRYWIRGFIIRKLAWDDAAHLLALLLLLAQVSIVTGGTSVVYRIADNDQDPADVRLAARLDIAGIMAAWCCLWAVKGAFLLLYRSIFQISTKFIRAWWSVVVISIATFWVVIAGSLTECGAPSNLENAEICNDPSMIRRQRGFVIYSCILNVVSDLLIMALPLVMLKGLQMRFQAKLGLAGVFCCAFIIIAFDILRTAETLTNDFSPGSTALWTNLESAIAVIVSCLPSFATLLRSKDKKARPYRPRSLAMSDSAKLCISAGSSIKDENSGHFSATASSETIKSPGDSSTDMRSIDAFSTNQTSAV